MVSKGRITLVLTIAILLPASSTPAQAKNTEKVMNVIDNCWRCNLSWQNHRQQLANCLIGYSGKMTNNVGTHVTNYLVTDLSNDPVSPKPGTLRYAMTNIRGKKWMTFQRDMKIELQRRLLISNFTTIDGRGASIHIAGGACLLLQRVTNVIIHGLQIHDCQIQGPGLVMVPDRNIVNTGPADGDAIRIVTSSKIWIDHNTFYDCPDGLIDVTRGSTDVTISNNWSRYQNKVMLLGHDDGFLRDRNMKVTVAFNYFGPSWKKDEHAHKPWNFQSVEDLFENGACFNQNGASSGIKPNYNPEQQFKVANAKMVRSLTRTSGALRCPKRSRC